MVKDSVCSNRIEDAIGSLPISKKISKDDGNNSDATATLAFSIYKTEQRIHLDKIISDHGLHTAFKLSHTLTFVITLPAADDIMTAQSGSKVQGYT